MTDEKNPGKVIDVGPLKIANHLPLVLFCGLNVMESSSLALDVAGYIDALCKKLGIPFVFKASFDKANRSSIHSYRGIGLKPALDVFESIKSKLQIPVITDIHEPFQAESVGSVCDVIQIPAFLARQTDLIAAAAKTGKVLNIKKPQFMAPSDIPNVLQKCAEAGNNQVIVCERGSSFGYNNLVVDMLSFQVMKQFGNPVMFDVTHSLQLPGGLGSKTDGRRQHLTPLALSGVAQGISSLFLEVHPDPDSAKCDGPCALRLDLLEAVLSQIKLVDDLVKSFAKIDSK